jgi:hypothetical protein
MAAAKDIKDYLPRLVVVIWISRASVSLPPKFQVVVPQTPEKERKYLLQYCPCYA